jgi:hypothetical protein
MIEETPQAPLYTRKTTDIRTTHNKELQAGGPNMHLRLNRMSPPTGEKKEKRWHNFGKTQTDCIPSYIIRYAYYYKHKYGKGEPCA